MATYNELYDLFSDSALRLKVEVAICAAAQSIIDGGDDTDPPWDQAAGQHDIRAKWANSVLASTRSHATQFLKYLLAANSDLTVAQIQGATDTAIQDKVNGAVDELAKAEFGA